MKKICLSLIIAGVWLTAKPALAINLSGELNLYGTSFEEKIIDSLDIDIIGSGGQKSFFATGQINNHSLGFGVMMRETPVRSNTLIHMLYSYNWQIASFMKNESSLALGILDSCRPNGYSYLSFNQCLVGAQDYLRFELGRNTRLGIGGAVVRDLKDRETDWDNAKWEAYFQYALSAFQKEVWLFDLRAGSKVYNPDRYWFVEKRDWQGFRTGPQFSGNWWQINLFGGIDSEITDGEQYKRIYSFGTTLGIKAFSDNILQFRVGSSRDTIRKVETGVASITIQNPRYSIEIYGLARNGEGWQQERAAGFKITTGLELDFLSRMFSPEDYRDPVRRSDFYSESGFQDDLDLSIEEQAKRLNTLSLRNEWSGANLNWVTYGGPGRFPSEVYTTRDGDCDDQAMLTAWMDRRNGYRSYLLCYWPVSNVSYIGHGVEVVQDPRTGRWFLDEYGTLQEIKVPANAPIRTVMEEALRQCASFTALPIGNGQEVYYWIDEPTQNPSVTNYLGWGMMSNYQSTAGSQPRLEKGYELFVGPDALFP